MTDQDQSRLKQLRRESVTLCAFVAVVAFLSSSSLFDVASIAVPVWVALNVAYEIVRFIVPDRHRSRALDAYYHFPRRLIPTWVYRLWLRTGIMDEDAYRRFQDRGYIRDDLDPEHIQRIE